jgi:ribonuclease J
VVGQDKRTGKINPNIVEVVTRGFIYVKDSKELMNESKKFITKSLNSRIAKSKDWNEVRRSVERDIDKFLYKKAGRTPLIIVHALPI